MTFFPLRVVYMPMTHEADEDAWDKTQAQMLISVPKRYFKRAVKRNRVKRQVRDAYRKHKSALLSKLADSPQKSVAVAFIWLDSKLYSEDSQVCVSANLRLTCTAVDAADKTKGFKWTVAPDEKTPRCK